MEGLQVEGDLLMQNDLLMPDAAGIGDVMLTDVHIGGQLALTGSKITCPVMQLAVLTRAGLEPVRATKTCFRMSEVQIGQSLFMNDAQFYDVSLTGVHVGGQLLLNGSKLAGPLDIDDTQVYSTVFLSRGAEFDGPVTLDFGKIGENIELAGGSFNQDVDFTGTQIGGELRLAELSRGGTPHLARWSPSSTLTLQNTSVAVIEDAERSWPNKLDLNGFTYREWEDPSAAGSLVDRSAEWFEDWLNKQAFYTPAPYQQLATVLRQQGQPDTADEILYTAKERERDQAPFLSWLKLTASKWFVGYGYHLFRSAYWALSLVFVGAALLWASGQGRRISRHYNFVYGLGYSFDFLLPIIRLREKHYKIDLHGPVRYYFYAHKIMGYVLASFLIA
jgi:hypothetical protein